MEEAEERVQQLLEEEKVPELEFGAIYTGRVVEVLDRGVMLQVRGGGQHQGVRAVWRPLLSCTSPWIRSCWSTASLQARK
jgi:hypothetical protein